MNHRDYEAMEKQWESADSAILIRELGSEIEPEPPLAQTQSPDRSTYRFRPVSVGNSILCTINAVWLYFHTGRPVTEIGRCLDKITTKVIREVLPAGVDGDEHDIAQMNMMLILASVLGNSKSNRVEVAKGISFADPTLKTWQYWPSLNGVIAARILGDKSRETEQLSILLKQGRDPYNPTPGKKLMTAFVEERRRDFIKTVEDSCKKHWEPRFIGELGQGLIMSARGNLMVLHALSLDSRWYWLYIECALLRLAGVGPDEIRNSFWLPHAFLDPAAIA